MAFTSSAMAAWTWRVVVEAFFTPLDSVQMGTVMVVIAAWASAWLSKRRFSAEPKSRLCLASFSPCMDSQKGWVQ